MSQAMLGDRVGLSRQQISNYEAAKVANPPAEVLTALAVELGDDPADYLRLAGRLTLTAEDLRPARTGELSPETAAAVERAVANSLGPLIARLDRVIELLEHDRAAQ